jgi:hypothetical protein
VHTLTNTKAAAVGYYNLISHNIYYVYYFLKGYPTRSTTAVRTAPAGGMCK